MSTPSNYYVSHKRRFLAEFNLVAKSASPVLNGHFEGENVAALVADARQEFESLIPQLPYIGGKQPFTEFIVFTGMLLALYRVAKVQGKTAEQTGELVFEIGRAFLKSPLAFLLRLFKMVDFSPRTWERMKERALESHQRKYPDGYVYDFVEGDGKTFDYGVDYLECASCKYLTREGAPELASYLCPVDILYSDALGWGLVRTQTLAEGAPKCDFRFKKGGRTNVAVPPAMQHVIERS